MIMLVQAHLEINKTNLPAVKKTTDLINGECKLPEKLDRFFKALIGVKIFAAEIELIVID